MDAFEFLQRVVAPGAYYAFAYKRPESSGLRHKFFKQTDCQAAVDWLRYTSHECDVWHAVASFKTNANRKQSNTEALRCFWYDADISRPGDGKAAGTTWADARELAGWLVNIKDDLPLPNVWMSSGYGVHLYWVLDSAIPAAEWTVHARAFRGLLKALGARGDIGISADSARVLRPPETRNHKVPDDPQPCRVITPARITSVDFVTKDFLKLLTPGVTGGLGPPPNRRVSTKSLEAAKANLSKPPPADFAAVAGHCLQVKKSLDEAGEADPYPLWHLLVNLTYFCDDREAAHAIGHKHPKYSEDDTDAKFDKTGQEHKSKQNFGAPSCESFDTARSGVCDNCQYRGNIKTPYTLGWAVDLPAGYRQQQSPEGLWKSAGEDEWDLLVKGNVSDPQLFYLGPETGFHFTFNYTLTGHASHIRVDESKISGTPDKVRGVFVPKGITLNSYTAKPFSEFVVAWIQKLKEARQFHDAPPAFGWVPDDHGGYLGLSVAGTFYRVDGTEGIAQPGDQTIHRNYQPKGDIKLWRQATEYVIGEKPELHTLVGASFAAPLMELIGESGILSIWSQLSGARKTSAFRVGTAVWCNPITGMSAIKDTTNSVQQALGETKIMPVFWDEVHTATREQVATMVEMFFNITQGRGRARLDQRMEQRAVGYWRTLMILSSNKPSAEIIEQDRSHTNAGALRLFEYAIAPTGDADQEAVSIVQLAEHNHGHAGRAYVKWLVLNLEVVQSVLKTIRKMIYTDVKDIRPEERFHVATITGIVAGAWIANKIGLVNLDWQGVYAFLKSQLRDIRGQRQDESPSDEGALLLNKFEKFISDNTEDILVTQSFVKAGRPSSRLIDDRIKVVKAPNFKCARAMIHIGLDEQEMRFDHNAFKQWCGRNGQSHTALLGTMYKLWPIKKVQMVLAVGTEWSSGAKVYYHKLVLTAPELAHHLSWGTPVPSNVIPLHPTAAE